MKTDLKKPCSECPFRRTSPAGWLGPWDSARDLLAVAGSAQGFPCHKTIPRGGLDDLSEIEGLQACAGAGIHHANSFKLPIHPDMVTHKNKLSDMPDYEEQAALVFQWPTEMINHHDG